MITLYRILEIYGIDPSTVCLVRHGDYEIPIRETFVNDLPKLESYQSFQQPEKFKKDKSVVVFAPYYKTTALFLGLWDIHGYSDLTNESLAEMKKYGFPEIWQTNGTVKYDLRKNAILNELSERLVIEWGRGTVAWLQRQDKEIVELKGKKSIGDFESFDQIELSYRDLKTFIKYPERNITWVKALSSVNGIYLIQDKSSGKRYVGSAYGEKGIFGRWCTYALTGHAENIDLKDLDPNNFQFSILEIIPPATTADGVIERENRWKEKLGTRQFGLNKN